MNSDQIKEGLFNCLAWSATLLATVFWLGLMAVLTSGAVQSPTGLIVPLLGLGVFLKMLIGSRKDNETKPVFKLALSVVASFFAICMGFLLKMAIDAALPH
jgi:hypothetical protein